MVRIIKKLSGSRYIINKYSYNDYFNVLEDIGKTSKIIVLDEEKVVGITRRPIKYYFSITFLDQESIMSLKYKVSLIYFAAIKTQETKPFMKHLEVI